MGKLLQLHCHTKRVPGARQGGGGWPRTDAQPRHMDDVQEHDFFCRKEIHQAG